MKLRLLPALIAILLITPEFVLAARSGVSLHEAEIVMPHAIKDKNRLYQAGRFFFAGQPDSVTFQWLAEQGVTLVINIRTDQEMEKHNKEKFDEIALVKQLGVEYVSIPVGGNVGYRPSHVYKLANVLRSHEGKALIHCTRAGRVSYLWVAYLIKYRGLSVEEAITIGENINFKFLLEDLLGYSLSITSE